MSLMNSIYQRREGFLEGANKNRLFFQLWENPKATGTIIITHGQGEHSDCYHRLVNYFADSTWSFYAWDMRGHGRSEGKRGFAESLEDYVSDYKLFLNEVLHEPQVKNRPVVLLSHSMGGEVQLKTLIEEQSIKPTAQVYSAPLLGLSLPVPAWKKQGSLLLQKVMPGLTLWNEINNDQLTRDPLVVREFEADVLRHDKISSGVFLGMLDNFKFIRENASLVRGPLLFQCPEDDPVVSTPDSKEIFELLGSTDKTLLTYGAGARHEMYNDIHRADVFADLKKFLERFKK